MTEIEKALVWLTDNVDDLDADTFEDDFPRDIYGYPDFELSDQEIEVIKEHTESLFYDTQNFITYVMQNLWN